MAIQLAIAVGGDPDDLRIALNANGVANYQPLRSVDDVFSRGAVLVGRFCGVVDQIALEGSRTAYLVGEVEVLTLLGWELSGPSSHDRVLVSISTRNAQGTLDTLARYRPTGRPALLILYDFGAYLEGLGENDLLALFPSGPILSPVYDGVWFRGDDGDVVGSREPREALEYGLGPFDDFDDAVRILEEAAP